MKIKKNIIVPIIILCLIFSFQSCEKTESNSTHPTKSIKGLAFIKGSSSTVKYSPKGNFIHIKLSDSGLWKNIVLKKSNNLINSKLFFLNEGDKRSLLYDNLPFGNYQIEYVSELRDTITEEFEFNKSIEIEFPQKLNEFYNEIGLEDLKTQSLKQNDTLQLLYQNYGCFGLTEILAEFIYEDNDEISLRKKDVLGSSLEANNDWVYIENIEIKENLDKFTLKSKKIFNSDLDLCTSDMIYTFRKKHSNSITVIEDKSCELIEEIQRLLF